MPSSTRRHRGATGLLGPCPWGTAWSSQSSCCTWSCAVLHYRAAGSECHTLPVSQADRGLWEAAGPCVAPLGALAQPRCCTLWLCPHLWVSVSGCCSRSSCQPKARHSGPRSAPDTADVPPAARQCQGHCSCCPQCCLCVGTAVLPSGRSGCTRDKQSQDCPGFTLLGLHLPTFLHAYSPHAPNPG